MKSHNPTKQNKIVDIQNSRRKEEVEYACTWDMLVSRVAVTTEELSYVCRVRATRGDGIYQDFGIVPHRADANLERVIVKATI